MKTLAEAVELAAEIAYEEDEDQYVILLRDDIRVVSAEDPEAYTPGVVHRFLIHSDGVDQGHIDRGEITEDWKLPNS